MTVLPEADLFGNAVAKPAPKLSTRWAFDAYRHQLDPRERGALAQQVRALLREGFSVDTLTRELTKLGRERAFPGLLGERVRSAPVPCVNGMHRMGLSRAQLSRCSCPPCREWLAVRAQG